MRARTQSAVFVKLEEDRFIQTPIKKGVFWKFQIFPPYFGFPLNEYSENFALTTYYDLRNNNESLGQRVDLKKLHCMRMSIQYFYVLSMYYPKDSQISFCSLIKIKSTAYKLFSHCVLS